MGIRNLFDYVFFHKREFKISDIWNKETNRFSRAKVHAMYPEVPGKYKSKMPGGFVLGKVCRKYFCVPLEKENILHAAIIGAPGSGKSSGPYLSTLLANFMQDQPPMTVFCVDIKPELAMKSVELAGNEHVRVINPTDRNSWGWDVYYKLNADSTDDEILSVADGVARALIVSNNEKDAFFVNSARSILKGFLLYYFRMDKDFIDTLEEIMGNELGEQIKLVYDLATLTPSGKKVRGLLGKFIDKSSQAMQDIELTLHENLYVFLSENVKYCVCNNPQKACPKDLNGDISIFLSLPENVLDEYGALFRLMVYQTLEELENRSEAEKPLAMILDEFARLRTVRNKQI